MRIAFFGDRRVSVRMCDYIRAQGAEIVALGLNMPFLTPHGAELKAAAGVADQAVFHGPVVNDPVIVQALRALDVDLGISCGFDPIISRAVLDLPRHGWVNVHRSLLPLNRGLDPLQWAIIEKRPAGVSIHVMTEDVDAGEVLAQVEVPVVPTDDADTLSERADEAAFRLFCALWPRLEAGDVSGRKQDEALATYHSFADCLAVRRLDLRADMNVGRLLRILQAYSGNGRSAAYFEVRGRRFTVETHIRRWQGPPPPAEGREPS